ncbi:sugar ABC transporter permease [Spirochaetia bacterium]|nr:sugar ABC transporter permease [Spirochaetia bacterium]
MAKSPESFLSIVKTGYMQKSEWSGFTVLVVLGVVTAILNPAFLGGDSLINLARAISMSLIPCIGLTFALGAGEIDLSPGAMLALSGVMAGLFIKRYNMPVFPAVLLTLVIAGACGALMGWVIVQFSVHSMIATLGFQNIFRGFLNVLTEGHPYTGFPDSFLFFGKGSILGLPVPIYLSIIALIVGMFLLKNTVFGRSVVAVGGNIETARLAGIRTKKYIILVHVLSSVCAGIAGLLTAARIGSAQVMVGSGLEMNALAAVVIGGTSLAGGSPTVVGTLVGVAIIELIAVALSLVRVDVYWQKVVLGIIIVIAVAADTYKRARLASGKG